MDDLIRRSEAIEVLENTDWYHQNANKDMVSGANSNEHQAWYKADDVYRALESVPSAEPERIQNNAVHLCDSCQYTYVTCPSRGNDAVFGYGKGNDNICACNKYRPISAQPERQKGEWRPFNPDNEGFTRIYECSECNKKIQQAHYSKVCDFDICPNCGADMR